MTVLLGEFRLQLDAYLAGTPPDVKSRSLADLVRYNRDNAAREMPLFSQDLFEQALLAPGTETPQYREARATALRLADAEGLSHLLRKHEVEALLLPTAPLAWKIDAVNGDQTPYGRAGGMASVSVRAPVRTCWFFAGLEMQAPWTHGMLSWSRLRSPMPRKPLK